MKKAGGIIALIAGIFGVIAAFVTLMIGGVGSAVEAKNAQTVVMLGWGGVAFSFLTIVLGAICMNAASRVPGVLLIICAIAGAILGGTIVAIFMVLALIGGVLALFGKRAPVAVGTAGLVAAALIMIVPQDAAAENKTVDIIDFLVDGADLVGKTVTVTGCKFTAATDTSVLCSAGMQGNAFIDSKTLDREDLRRALRNCGGFVAPPQCLGSVTGQVTKGPLGLRLSKASIGWPAT
ncbi:hypothetical protein [Bosea sp. (in: a-proteobacteria)]|uniref:hypothetical protein n=1 Tax=Bosea sp. (in: a-proteobacteria) TaxID=1871050 RepID=UPI0031FEDE97